MSNTPWYLWPFVALWRLVAGIIGLTGRLVAVLLGVVLFVAGGLLTLTVVGAIAGIPLMIIGVLLIVRGIF
ncbi:MAG TPA: hypothetical protein VF276_11380 [Chloroflexia bacterium]